jgi:16S rRNA (uracil1498-N3)-methyltransferase
MRLHRFYIAEKIEGKSVTISNRDLIHQWRKVFRYNVGSQVIVFDGSGIECRAVIMKVSPSEAELSILETKDIPAPTKNLWLCLSLIKKDNFELVVQKAVELGVNHIVPILGERSEKKKLNMERLEKIVHEATEQSGRGELMKVYEPTTLPKLFSSGMLPQEKIFFHPEYPPVQDYLSAQTKQYSFAYFIGPEGGFSEEEIELFKKHNVSGFALGPRILRAETAAIVGATLLGMSF